MPLLLVSVVLSSWPADSPGGPSTVPRQSAHSCSPYMDPPALSRRLQVKKHASGQMQPYIRPLSEDIQGLRALMKSALPHLITTAASWALYLRRLGGGRSDRSCHQLESTSHRAAGLL